jgi:hypothetical protein
VTRLASTTNFTTVELTWTNPVFSTVTVTCRRSLPALVRTDALMLVPAARAVVTFRG